MNKLLVLLSKYKDQYNIRYCRKSDIISAKRVACLAGEAFGKVYGREYAPYIEKYVFDYCIENNVTCDPIKYESNCDFEFLPFAIENQKVLEIVIKHLIGEKENGVEEHILGRATGGSAGIIERRNSVFKTKKRIATHKNK